MSAAKYCFYFVLDRVSHYITDVCDDMQTMAVQNMQDNRDIYCYECFAGYDANRKGLLKFRDDFNRWADELLQHRVNYRWAYDNHAAVISRFRLHAKSLMDKWMARPRVTIESFESEFMEKCFNGGLTYLSCKDKTVQTYGYDWSAFYPNIMGNENLGFQMPVSAGRLCKLETLDFDKLQYGIYRARVYCDQDVTPDYDPTSVFAFSKHGYYTHYSLILANSRKSLKLRIQLETACEYNALLYDDLRDTADIFGKWFQEMQSLKEKLPQNKLVKHLGTSLWGHLIKFERAKFIDAEEFADCDMDLFGSNSDSKYEVLGFDGERFELIERNKPYSYPLFARMKPFLVSYGRDIMARFIFARKIKKQDIIRIHTDGMTLATPQDFSSFKSLNGFKYDGYKPICEAKTTGLIRWTHVNSYKHLCACGELFAYFKNCYGRCERHIVARHFREFMDKCHLTADCQIHPTNALTHL
jgi:hypothetical protein